MVAPVRGRFTTALYSSATSLYCHRVRYLLAEKNIHVDVINVDPRDPPEDLIDLNPYNSVPTLVDRELVLYGTAVITEYVDERYPHPPLMTVDPVSRGRTRLALHRIEQDWYSLAEELEVASGGRIAKLRKQLTESLTASADAFAASRYFLSEEMTLVDCALVPLLWRLDKYGIDLPDAARPVNDYARRMFATEAFRKSLTEAEREMRS